MNKLSKLFNITVNNNGNIELYQVWAKNKATAKLWAKANIPNDQFSRGHNIYLAAMFKRGDVFIISNKGVSR
jgi:hypothetical protein